MEESVDISGFAASFRGFMETMASQSAGNSADGVQSRLKAHFGDADLGRLAVVSAGFQKLEHADLHLAVLESLSGVEHEMLGLSTSGYYASSFSLAQLMGPNAEAGVSLGPVEYIEVELSENQTLSCLKQVLILVQGPAPMAVLLLNRDVMFGVSSNLALEVMCPEREAAESFVARVRQSMRRNSVYRGHVISLSGTEALGMEVKFHRLPEIARDDIILPVGLLTQIERHSLVFSRHRERLLASGRHLKRGLLLHGPPGTGKTLTAMYLAGLDQERTVLLCTGRSQGLLSDTCSLARKLSPATIILEDVDLIAENRNSVHACQTLLFELLNEMDGLSEDSDILFVLTTNRPELLEPALAARPGRIDQALEVPLPDADCRERLLKLYLTGLNSAVDDFSGLVSRTEAVSAAFIRELVRRATLLAAEESEELLVTERHLYAALRELALSKLTKKLLGADGLLT